MQFPPHEPPPNHWEDYVKRIYIAGTKRIDKSREQLDPETGAIPIPFICYGCELEKIKIALINGDGLPMCTDCINSICDNIETVVI